MSGELSFNFDRSTLKRSRSMMVTPFGLFQSGDSILEKENIHLLSARTLFLEEFFSVEGLSRRSADLCLQSLNWSESVEFNLDTLDKSVLDRRCRSEKEGLYKVFVARCLMLHSLLESHVVTESFQQDLLKCFKAVIDEKHFLSSSIQVASYAMIRKVYREDLAEMDILLSKEANKELKKMLDLFEKQVFKLLKESNRFFGEISLTPLSARNFMLRPPPPDLLRPLMCPYPCSSFVVRPSSRESLEGDLSLTARSRSRASGSSEGDCYFALSSPPIPSLSSAMDLDVLGPEPRAKRNLFPFFSFQEQGRGFAKDPYADDSGDRSQAPFK